MSNYLAIAAVTETLRQYLYTVAREAVPEVDVIPGRPHDAADEKATIYLYLYQVQPGPALRNADLPTRRNDGSLALRPQVALTLHYLLSFYGKEQDYVPQRLLGRVASALHAQPVLPRDAIRSAIQNPINANSDFLKSSDLADQVELVRFAPLVLNLEELSRLWSVFIQTPYGLSMAYSASVVLIEEPLSLRKALPVTRPLIYVAPSAQPLVEAVQSAAGSEQPILTGSQIEIRGQRLRAALTRVQIDDAAYDPLPGDITPQIIRLDLPAGLLAGVHSLRVVQPLLLGDPPSEHAGAVSNQAAFPLLPEISAIVAHAHGSLQVTFNPAVGRDQRVSLLLTELAAPAGKPPRSYRIAAPPNNGIANPHQPTTPTIAFAAPDLPAGSYLASVQVNGAESRLRSDAQGVYSEPHVEVA